MNQNLPESESKNVGPRLSQQVNWWGIFGLLCGIGSAYLSLRILFEAISLLGKGP